MNTSNPISVPMQIDAMWSEGTTKLSPPTVDFTKLQSTVGDSGNFSNSSPWLGDTTYVSLNNDYTLPTGVHLHWTLPKALRQGTTVYVLDYETFNELVQQGIPCSLLEQLQTKVTMDEEYTLDQLNQILTSLVPQTPGPPLSKADFARPSSPASYSGLISSDNGISVASYTPSFQWDPLFLEIYGPIIIHTATRMKLPPVPDRWLVVRENTVSGDTTAWVVESDRLTTPSSDGTAPAGAGPNAIPGQFDSAFVTKWSNVTAANALLFLGFKAAVQDWSEASGVSRLAPLTAAGPGIPDFAAFYPNCQGVFGFHDETASQTTAYQYTIIGWFSDAENDPLSSSYAVEPWSSKTERPGRPQALGWTIASADWDTIDGSVYTAKISVTGTSCTVQASTDLESVDVAIGNTAGEALSAYLATGQTQGGLGLAAESILNAAQAGVLDEALEPDGPAIIENALHSKGFEPQSGGWIWQVAASASQGPGLSSGAQSGAMKLTDDVAQALSQLNGAQLEFDRVQMEQRAQRHLLFTDWCRVLHFETDVSGSGFPNATTLNNAGSMQLGDVAGSVINTSAAAVKYASVGGQTEDASMLTYLAAETLYLAYAQAAAQLAAMPGGSGYSLRRQPAPRFWRPNDPTIMMCDDTGTSLLPAPPSSLPYTDIDGKEYLTLKDYPLATSSPSYLPANWDANSGVPVGAYISGAVAAIPEVSCARSWRPLSLNWEAQYFHFPGVGTITSKTPSSGPFTVTPYDQNFIADNFVPDPAGIDLIPKTGVSPVAAPWAAYEGRVPLSGHATQTMRARILQLSGQVEDPPANASGLTLPGALGQGEAKNLLETAYGSTAVTLSQSLNGFNDRLLMLRRIPQISIFDANYALAPWNNPPWPMRPWDSCSQSFYDEIGVQSRTSPDQNDIYNPIRAGKCELTLLKLIDSFGQIRVWSYSPNNTVISSALPNETAPGADAAPAFLLPPRFSQASRLLFRWLAADGSGDAESNPYPATSPVCGWAVLNRVDETVMIFDQGGALLGWVPADGGSIIFMPGKTTSNITDPFLKHFVAQAQATGNTLYDDVNTALLTIQPRSHRQHAARTVLMSRPLALARASLRLQLSGVPAPHQGYGALAAMNLDTNNEPATGPAPSPYVVREECGFTQVEIPVRLGDVSMDDDGLVAYWSVDEGGTIGATYILVAAGAEAGPDAEPTVDLKAAPGVVATQVLLLFDPRAPVHVTSGILPVEAATIPPALYAAAVGAMNYLMQAGPVLTPANQVSMPLPAEAGPWRWLVQQNGAWAPPVTPSKSDDAVRPMADPAVVRTGWLQTETDND